jgi:hypothetical protein
MPVRALRKPALGTNASRFLRRRGDFAVCRERDLPARRVFKTRKHVGGTVRRHDHTAK